MHLLQWINNVRINNVQFIFAKDKSAAIFTTHLYSTKGFACTHLSNVPQWRHTWIAAPFLDPRESSKDGHTFPRIQKGDRSG